MGKTDPKRSSVTKCFRVRRPCAKAGRDHVPNDGTDIAFLRRVIVRPGMVARDRHRPTALARPQFAEETRRIGDIQPWIEHRLDGRKALAMVMMVDLHTAKVDQPSALAAGR